MVEVLTLPNGLSAEEVEQLVTVPLEFGLGGMRDLESMRSISLFGLSDIRCYFDWESDYYWDRTETINQLGTFITCRRALRAGISPENPIGEIYRYTVESPDHDLIKEKEIEDWVLEKQLENGAGRDRRLRLRRTDQGIPRRRRSAATGLLPRSRSRR